MVTKMPRRACWKLVLSVFLTVALLGATAHAENWPSRTVTIVVPFGPGGNTDMMARLAAQDLSQNSARISSSKTARVPAV
jgi:tripartite-type tricarboxylate transporter receptor subunit TctC